MNPDLKTKLKYGVIALAITGLLVAGGWLAPTVYPIVVSAVFGG